MGCYDVFQFDPYIENYKGLGDFQTKSLESILDNYWVTDDGDLYKRVSFVKADNYICITWNKFEYNGDIEIHDGENSFIAKFKRGELKQIVSYDRYPLDVLEAVVSENKEALEMLSDK